MQHIGSSSLDDLPSTCSCMEQKSDPAKPSQPTEREFFFATKFWYDILNRKRTEDVAHYQDQRMEGSNS